MNNLENKKILSPCISICKNDPATNFCYGCARTDEEKKYGKIQTQQISGKRKI